VIFPIVIPIAAAQLRRRVWPTATERRLPTVFGSRALKEPVLPVVCGRALPEPFEHFFWQKLFRFGDHSSVSADYGEL
jgi:hypothetical protein